MMLSDFWLGRVFGLIWKAVILTWIETRNIESHLSLVFPSFDFQCYGLQSTSKIAASFSIPIMFWKWSNSNNKF